MRHQWERFLAWLRLEPRGWEWARFLGLVFGATILLALLCAVVARALVPIGPSARAAEIDARIYLQPGFLLMAAALEEWIFRLPLVFFLPKYGVGGLTMRIAVVVSAVFGELHGPWHVLIQGPTGFVLCLVFIKCGGARGVYLKAYVSAVLVHLAYNSIVVLPFLLSAL